MITLPRTLLTLLGALFSAYHVFLGIHSSHQFHRIGPAAAALVIYAAASTVSLWPARETSMPRWMSWTNVAVAVALPTLVTGVLDRGTANGYGTWYVGAVGTLMTVTMVRRRRLEAWLGIAFLVGQSIWWVGPIDFIFIGVLGGIVWVGVADVMSRTIIRAAREAAALHESQREAAAWQAAQAARRVERRGRLARTRNVAGPLLWRIVSVDGELSAADQSECRYVEAALRDEIRGRMLLNDDVRAHAQKARRRGTTVTMLDQGGLDEMTDAERRHLLHSVAEALGTTNSHTVIVRTTPHSETVAITVVALSSPEGGTGASMSMDSDDEVDLWLELPRPGAQSAEPAPAPVEPTV